MNRDLSYPHLGRYRWDKNPVLSGTAPTRVRLATYLDICLNIYLNLSGTSVRQGKYLSLIISLSDGRGNHSLRQLSECLQQPAGN